VSHSAAARSAAPSSDIGRYQHHRPGHTLLDRIVEEYYPVFLAHIAERGIELPGYVQREFDDYLQRVRLECGFLRVRCDVRHAEQLAALSVPQAPCCYGFSDAWPVNTNTNGSEYGAEFQRAYRCAILAHVH
jgi:hypothetical protein